MDIATLIEHLRRMDACAPAIQWLGTLDPQASAYSAWRACERGDWLVWLVTQPATKASDDALRAIACDCARRVLPIWETWAVEHAPKHLEAPRRAVEAGGYDPAAGSAARSAAWSAAEFAAESAAWSAAEFAAESAAWSAAWSAARSAAGSAAGSAAESAARSAARSAAESAARSAARSAAWSAAWSAAEFAAESAHATIVRRHVRWSDVRAALEME